MKYKQYNSFIQGQFEYVPHMNKYNRNKRTVSHRRLIGVTLLLLAALVALGGMQRNYEHQFAQSFFDSVEGHNIYPNSITVTNHATNVRIFNMEIGVNPTVAAMPQEFHKLKHPLIDWKIYGLESSFGKNDSCKDQGKINGFGFGQSTFSWQCFDNLAQVAGYVDDWVDLHLSYQDLPHALCLYNQGKIEKDCTYYEHYLSLGN